MPLFAAGRATPFLMAQWKRRGGLQPLQVAAVLVEKDGTATKLFRSIWTAAFPDRQRLPSDPVATAGGQGTDAFWDVFV